jgi:hypothetical protein
MTTQQTFLNCKYWLDPPCPEKENEFMQKTKIVPQASDTPVLTGSDFRAVDKICSRCSNFEHEIEWDWPV